MNSHKVCIIGAGLVGTMLASYLAQRGFKVDLFEKRPDIRKDFISGNRTIAMSISHRGFKGLAGIGLSKFVDDHTIPKHSRMVHKKDGTTMSQQYGKDGHTINTVNRRQLNEALIDKAESTGAVTFYFEHECEVLNPDTGEISFRNYQTNDLTSREYRYIIGADGLFSNIRNILEDQKLVSTEFLTVNFGYRELLIPPDKNGQFILEKEFVHVWPRDNYIIVGLPSEGGSFTCNLFLPSEGDLSLAEIQNKEDVLRLFNKLFPNIIPLMPTLVEDYFGNAASKINAIKTTPWNYKDRILLIGDAAHAIVPFFAMGMNTVFEDCTVFDQMLDRYDNDISKVIELYGTERKPDTDAISDLSYRNFSEISKSPDPDYDLKWRIDRTIWDLFPDKWMPLYPMIAFSHIPLSIAITRAAHQRALLLQAISDGPFKGLKDTDCIQQAVREYFKPILEKSEPIPR